MTVRRNAPRNLVGFWGALGLSCCLLFFAVEISLDQLGCGLEEAVLDDVADLEVVVEDDEVGTIARVDVAGLVVDAHDASWDRRGGTQRIFKWDTAGLN